MVFFRNVQLRWMPVNKGNHQLWFAFERPGASADVGTLSGRVELQGVQARFPAPDLSARARVGGERSYLQIAGMGRYISWDDLKRSAVLDLGGHLWGWGVNVSSNVGVGKKLDWDAATASRAASPSAAVSGPGISTAFLNSSTASRLAMVPVAA
jgi:hypothetical protein